MQDVLVSGKASFKVEVPYKLIEKGEKGKKPLIVYLHGYKQNLELFEKKVAEMLELNAYHLFIQGPYPIYDESRARNVSKWGRAWYLYDGNKAQFTKSLELTSEFIQEVIENLLEFIDVDRICLFGYSMGGYQAGYFALSRWKHATECIVIGARIKTEVFEGRLDQAKHIRFLAIHGENDTSVLPEPQQKEIEKLKKEGFDAAFVLLNEPHQLIPAYINESIRWLKERGY